MCEKSVVDDRRLITVAPYGMSRSGRCILDHGNPKALLDKLAQMGLDAHVRQHATEDDLTHSPFAQLQDQIVGLWPPHFMRTDDDCPAVFDKRLKAIQPVRARVWETR